MSHHSQPHSLLEQLDQMQDEVMRELDDLDERILGLIKHCTSASKLGIAEVSEGNLREAA